MAMNKKSYRDSDLTSNTSQSPLLNKQLKRLIEKRKMIAFKVEQHKERRSTISNYRHDLIEQHNHLNAVQKEIDSIKDLISQLFVQHSSYEERKMTLVIQIQDMQIRLSHLSQQLVQCYQITPTKLELLRFSLIQLETTTAMKLAEPDFSIRKAIIMFLKDQGMIKSQYQFGIELEISRIGKATDFRWFSVELLKQCHHSNEKRLIQLIDQYVSLLKQGESEIQSLCKQKNPKSIVLAPINKNQLTELIVKEKQKISNMHTELKEIDQKSSSILNRINELKEICAERQHEKKDSILKLQLFNQKIHYLQSSVYQQEDLEAQLAEIDEAIQYFQFKQGYMSQAKSQILIESQPPELCSPTSSISLPAFSDLMPQSQLVKTPVSKIHNGKRSTKKLLISNNRKSGSRLNSPISWK